MRWDRSRLHSICRVDWTIRKTWNIICPHILDRRTWSDPNYWSDFQQGHLIQLVFTQSGRKIDSKQYLTEKSWYAAKICRRQKFFLIWIRSTGTQSSQTSQFRYLFRRNVRRYLLCLRESAGFNSSSFDHYVDVLFFKKNVAKWFRVSKSQKCLKGAMRESRGYGKGGWGKGKEGRRC